MFFLRKTSLPAEPLAITMSGIRMGERLLQIGVDDLTLTAAMALKVGLSGSAAVAVPDTPRAERVRKAAERAGVLVDIRVNSFDMLPFENAAFDVVVVHGVEGLLASLGREARDVAALREAHRVLRQGGRIIVVEAGPQQGLARLVGGSRQDPQYAAAGGTSRALRSAAFKPVRVLSERDGYRFIEGLKS
jgi:SAM-dependent methyltransferase